MDPNIRFLIDKKNENNYILGNDFFKSRLTKEQIIYMEEENKKIEKQLNEYFSIVYTEKLEILI